MSRRRIVYPFAEQGNFTQCHNWAYDHLMPALSPNAWKVFSYIVRQTKGWHRDEVGLSQRAIMAGTGIKSFTTLAHCLAELTDEARPVIEIHRPRDVTEEHLYSLNTDFAVTYEAAPRASEVGLQRATESVARRATENVARPATESVARPATDSVALKKKGVKNSSEDKEDEASAAAAVDLWGAYVGVKDAWDLVEHFPESVPHAAAIFAEVKRAKVESKAGLLVKLVSTGWTPPPAASPAELAVDDNPFAKYTRSPIVCTGYEQEADDGQPG